MSIGPSGIIGSAAGSQLSQAQGTDVNKAQQDTANQARQAETDRKAESASGIGETEQDEQASERDVEHRHHDQNRGNEEIAQVLTVTFADNLPE